VQLKRFLLATCVGTAVCCGSGASVQPSPVIEDPILNCPSDVSVTAHNAATPTVSFDVPTASKGAPPVTVTCTPASGTEFKAGVTSVTCEAADSRAHKASCSFSVVVAARFMAFGDSLTEGKTRLIAPSIVQVPSGHFNAGGSYPEVLNAKLTARYQDQTITMVADGWGGEFAGEGKLRLQDDWSQYSPDALLLMEGTNDITDRLTNTPAEIAAAINSVIDALRTEIVFAKGKGARVFLGTVVSLVPPVRASSVAAIPTLNDRIRALAVEQRVTLVDINAVVPTTMISTIDGIHPAPGTEAYSLMADEWLKAIAATMEAAPSTLR
jgi:lysophospholipase L1-like esterase